MALTPQQKAENQAAAAVKRRAHKERYRLLRAAIAAAETSPEVLAAEAVANAASDAEERSRHGIEKQIKNLRKQIEDIERQIEKVRSDSAAYELRNAERAAWDRVRSIRSQMIADAESAFPDLSGNAKWSPAAWEPPQEVLDAMNAARDAVRSDVG